MNKLTIALLGLTLGTVVLTGPALAQTQQPSSPSVQPVPQDQSQPATQPGDQSQSTMQPSESLPQSNGPSTAMDGVISDIHVFNCGLTGGAQSTSTQECWAMIQVTSAPAPVDPMVEQGNAVSAINPVTVFVMPGTSVSMHHTGASVPVTALQKGDEIDISYQPANFGNVATDVTLVARLGGGLGYGY
ncbi:MAG TPA: hypothetical protein VEZ44_11005 [bacterium]|nr:hypothetical protein [bacterium]